MTTDLPSDREATMDAAALWLAQLDSGTADIDAFEAWRDSDPKHQAAFARIAGVSFQLDRLRKLTPPSAQPMAKSESKLNRRSAMGAAIGVSVAVGAGAYLTVFSSKVRASTKIGESRTVSLPDGGQLMLNTDSKVSWRFKGDRHEVWLERGEIALILKENAKPLFLHGGGSIVRLDGGDLNARLREQTLDLVVVQGSGRVTEAEGMDARSVAATRTIKAGQAAIIQSNAFHVRTIDAADLHFVSGWRSGELVFNGQSLGTAITEYNRYLPRKIVIIDASLQDLRLGGRFKTRDPSDFLAALESSFGIHVSRDDSGTVILSK